MLLCDVIKLSFVVVLTKRNLEAQITNCAFAGDLFNFLFLSNRGPSLLQNTLLLKHLVSTLIDTTLSHTFV